MDPDDVLAAIDRLDAIADALERQNELLEEQNEHLREIADGVEDRVVQHGLTHSTELHTDRETGRRRQS